MILQLSQLAPDLPPPLPRAVFPLVGESWLCQGEARGERAVSKLSSQALAEGWESRSCPSPSWLHCPEAASLDQELPSRLLCLTPHLLCHVGPCGAAPLKWVLPC